MDYDLRDMFSGKHIKTRTSIKKFRSICRQIESFVHSVYILPFSHFIQSIYVYKTKMIYGSLYILWICNQRHHHHHHWLQSSNCKFKENGACFLNNLQTTNKITALLRFIIIMWSGILQLKYYVWHQQYNITAVLWWRVQKTRAGADKKRRLCATAPQERRTTNNMRKLSESVIVFGGSMPEIMLKMFVLGRPWSEKDDEVLIFVKIFKSKSRTPSALVFFN